VGDQVVSYDPVAGEAAFQSITRTFIHSAQLALQIQVGTTSITCTPEHPFWIPGEGWRKAGTIRCGTPLLSRAGIVVYVESVQSLQGTLRVFNIEVQGLHTYYVSSLGVLVHNKSDVVAPLIERIRALRKEAFEAKQRADSIPVDNPNRFEIIKRIAKLQEKLSQLENDVADATPEDIEQILKPDYDKAETELSDLKDALDKAVPGSATGPWQERLDRAKWSDHGRKHMKARTEAEAKEMTTPTDADPDPASQYRPGENNQALELEALRNGEVIRGDPTDPEGGVHVRYDAGRVIGYDGGKPVTTLRAEISGDVYHGHPRNF